MASSIHVSKKRMLRNEELGVISLIHEASHKFGNTFDHGNAGYREEDDSDWSAPGLTMVEALVNADSYAYFAYEALSELSRLVLLTAQPERHAQSLLCGALVAIAVGNGARQWRQTLRWRYAWPQWSAQVTAWERQPGAPLHIWPRGWTMQLVRRR